MARYQAPQSFKRRSVDLQYDENPSTTFAPGRARDRGFDFEASFSANHGTSGALVPVPRYREKEETVGYERRGGYVERDRYIERDVYESSPGPDHVHRHVHREEIECAPPPPHRHHQHEKKRGSRIKKREHTTECICLDCVRVRRYGEEYRTSGTLIVSRDYESAPKPRKEQERQRDRERRTIGYGNYDDGYYHRTQMDVSEVIPPSPRGSGYLLSSQEPRRSSGMLAHIEETTRRSSGMLAHYPDGVSQDWTVVDVPPGTRRITVEPGSGPTEINWKNENSIRRTRGGNETTQGELWTEITKDLVTPEALDEFGYQYEETDVFIYIFEYLHRDQIQDLIELTKDIRRERVKDIEYYDRMEKMDRAEPRYESRDNRQSRGAEYYERDRYESREVYYT